MSAKKFTYVGNRDGNSAVSAIRYTDPTEEGAKPQGTVYEAGNDPEIRIGDEIKLVPSERDRLSPYFIFSDGEKEDIAPNAVAPTTQPPEAQTAPAASPSDDTLPAKATPSKQTK